jgi:large subunit ribosomal protein L7/L12
MPMAAAPAGAGAPAAAAETPAEEAAPAAAEKAILTVKLDSFDASAKAKVIREVKALLGCNLVEAKTLVEKAPTVIKENVVKEVLLCLVILTCRTPTSSKKRWRNLEQRLHWYRSRQEKQIVPQRTVIQYPLIKLQSTAYPQHPVTMPAMH